MIKKIIYGVGGVIGLLIIIGIFAPSPEPTQETQQAVHSEAVAEATTSEPVATASDLTTTETPDSNQPHPSTQTRTAPAAPAQTNPQYQYYAVTSVVDGDTLKINMDGTVETLRLIGIDTPETVDPRKPVQCFGTEASNRAKTLLSGQKVRIESDSTQDTRDKYGRLLVYAYRADGLFFNKSMVSDGYAYEYTYDKPYKYQAEFKAAQQAAKAAEKGLWSPSTFDGKAEPVSNPTPAAAQPSGHTFYTSSYYTSKYYYCDTDQGWKSLSSSYLKSYPSEADLLSAFPSRTLHQPCE